MSRRENVQQWKSLSAMLARGLPSMSAGYWHVAAACVLSCFSRRRCASHIISQSHTSALLSSRLTKQHHSLSTCEQTCYVQGLQDTNCSRELFKPYYIWTSVKELATCLINISFVSWNFFNSCRPYLFVENYGYKHLYRKHKASNFGNSNAKLPDGNEKKTVFLSRYNYPQQSCCCILFYCLITYYSVVVVINVILRVYKNGNVQV